MRIPTIVLLSSVALSLLASAENATPAAIVNANTNAAVVEATPEREAAPEPVSSLKMREDEKTYPVGNGIVFTKTTFFVDNNNNNNDDKNDNENGSTKVGATGLLDDLLGGLLGIDIDIGGKKKKKKDPPPTDSPTTTPKEEMGYDYILLYGDDGYKPRPVPKGCHELQFMDQMIWDQQGNRGEIEDASGQGPQAITLAPSADDTTKETDKKDSTEKKDSSDNRDSTDKSQKILAKIDTSAVTAVATDPKKEQDLTDNNSKAKKATDVDPEGIHICLLGPCKDDEEDREEEEEDDSKRRKIHHKQKKFLKKFRGKALKIDGHTGCPIPSEAA